LATRLTLLATVALVLGLFVATELFAYVALAKTGFAPATFATLGAPLYRELFVVAYPPWKVVMWWGRWGSRAGQAFTLPALVGCGVAGVVLYGGWPRTPTRDDQARWATDAEWQEADCLKETGIVLGKLR